MKTATPPRGYTASKDQLLNRLARVEGQVRGVRNMVEEDRYCIDVLTQVSAVQAALDRISLGMLDGHARVCMQREGGAPADRDEQVDELMASVGRLLRR
jgi:DNA-binding FrmR family transcriptional regulator